MALKDLLLITQLLISNFANHSLSTERKINCFHPKGKRHSIESRRSRACNFLFTVSHNLQIYTTNRRSTPQGYHGSPTHRIIFANTSPCRRFVTTAGERVRAMNLQSMSLTGNEMRLTLLIKSNITSVQETKAIFCA